MIKLFQPTDTNFSSNGDKIIQATKANVHKEDNGEFYLELECSLEYVNDIVQNNILVVNTPTGEQAFRIDNVEKTRTKLKTKAYHVYYDTENYLISDSNVVNKSCNDALDHLNSSTDNTSPFTTTSDITTIDSYRCVRKSLAEAIKVVLSRWGGHLVRNNFSIAIMSSIGQDNGVTVRYAKNLKNITATYDWNNVVTKLMPVGKDGIKLPEEYVYSETQYSIPYTKAISFDQSEILEENYTNEQGIVDVDSYHAALIEDLRTQAVQYITIHQYPEVNYTLDANLEKITDIGDTIEVIDEVLGIDIMTNLIGYTYDTILDKYKELQFGNFNKKLSDLLSNINNSVKQQVETTNEETRITLRNELQIATDKIWSALGSSYVIYDGDKILVLDAIPKENATNVIMINSGGIGFSNTGINGTFTSTWTIDNVLNMENINVINLTADLIKGGTLKLGSNLNQSGIIELYNEANALIGKMDSNGLRMYGSDESYVLLNNEVGFAGFDSTGNKIFWADKDEFHMKKSVIEEEITLCQRGRFIPMTIYDDDGFTVINDGIGFVADANASKEAREAEQRFVVVGAGQTSPKSGTDSLGYVESAITDIITNIQINSNYLLTNVNLTFEYNVDVVISQGSAPIRLSCTGEIEKINAMPDLSNGIHRTWYRVICHDPYFQGYGNIFGSAYSVKVLNVHTKQIQTTTVDGTTSVIVLHDGGIFDLNFYLSRGVG